MTHSPIAKVLPGPLRQPQNLATLISLGVHGLLFLGLAAVPLVSSNRDNGVVDVVTLTPEEQTRIAQSAPDLPPGTAALPLPNMPLPPDLQSYLPNGNSSFLPLPMPDGILPPPPNIEMPPMQDYIPAPLGPLQAPPRDTLPRWNTPGTLGRNPNPGPIDLPSPPTVGTAPTFPNPVPEASPPAPPVPPGTDPMTAVGSANQRLARYNNESKGNLTYEFKVSIPYSYPKAACAQRLSGGVSVQALFDTSGKLVANPDSPGFAIASQHEVFNQAALTAVTNARFAPTGKYVSRTFLFDFQYSEQVCGAATPAAPSSPAPASPAPSNPAPPGSDAPQPPRNPQPAASPTPTSSPTPSASPSPTAPTPNSSPSATPSPAASPEPPQPAAPSPTPAVPEPPKPAAPAPPPPPAAAPPAPSPEPAAPSPAAS